MKIVFQFFFFYKFRMWKDHGEFDCLILIGNSTCFISIILAPDFLLLLATGHRIYRDTTELAPPHLISHSLTNMNYTELPMFRLSLSQFMVAFYNKVCYLCDSIKYFMFQQERVGFGVASGILEAHRISKPSREFWQIKVENKSSI